MKTIVKVCLFLAFCLFVSAQIFHASSVFAQEKYVGFVSDKEKVEIVSQICSTIKKVAFKEGTIVNQGDLLYELDNTIQVLNVQKARGPVEQCAAEMQFESISEQKGIQKSLARMKLESAQAELKLAEYQLSLTKIYAPRTGRIGFNRYAAGSYVTPEKGALATIIPVDSAIVSFSLGQKTFLNHLDADGHFTGKVRVFMSKDELFPGKWKFDSFDNTINRETGSMTVNLRCENPDKKLFPGSVVEVTVEKE